MGPPAPSDPRVCAYCREPSPDVFPVPTDQGETRAGSVPGPAAFAVGAGHEGWLGRGPGFQECPRAGAEPHRKRRA